MQARAARLYGETPYNPTTKPDYQSLSNAPETRMAITKRLKADCRAAIARHLATEGSGDWDVVMKAYPGVPPSSFWRWVREVRAETLTDRAEPIPADIDPQAAQDAIDDIGVEAAVGQKLTRPPGVSDLCRAGVIDANAVLAEGLKIATEIIDGARDQNGKIRVSKTALQAVNVQANILKTAAAISNTLLEERRIRDFYRAVMAEIMAESPSCAARIAARLEALNSRPGLASHIGR